MPVGLYSGPDASTGNGVTTVFPYTFRILQSADLAVYLDGVLQSSGYTVSGVGESSGGNVTFSSAPANGVEVLRAREASYDRATDYQRNGAFDEGTVDADFDRGVMLSQQLKALIDRAPKLSLGSGLAGDSFSFPSPGAGEFLRWNNAGTALETIAASPDDDTFTASGAGAIARSWSAKVGEIVSVKDFGATGDGATDDTAAWQAAHDSLPSAGGKIIVPPGNYVLGTINISKPSVEIEFQGGLLLGTKITCRDTTGNILNVTQNGFVLRNCVIDSGSARTTGAYVDLNAAAWCVIENFRFNRPYIGIEIDGGIQNYVCNGSMQNITSDSVATGSAAIAVGRNTLSVANFVSNVVVDTGLGTTYALMPTYGIVAWYTDALFVHDSIMVHCGKGIAMIPGAGQACTASYIHDAHFDTGGIGVYIAPTSSGILARNRFDNVWAGSNIDEGIYVTGTATGTVTGTHFGECQCHINSYGLHVAGAGAQYVSDTNIAGGSFAQNTNTGIQFDDSSNRFTIRGARSGDMDGLTGNAYGIYIGNGCNNYVIEDNVLYGNATASFSSGTLTATGRIANNFGYNPVGVSPITVTASPFTYTAGPRPETVYIRGGTVSNITREGTSVFVATPAVVSLPPNKAVVVTYTVAPAMVADVH